MTRISYTKNDLLSLADRLERRGKTMLTQPDQRSTDLLAVALILRWMVQKVGLPVTTVEIAMDGRQ